jgi:hypothetical protein
MKLPRWVAARLHKRFGPSRVELQQGIDGLRAEIDSLEVKLAERTARVALVEGWNARANAECREAHQLRKTAEKAGRQIRYEAAQEVRRIQREVIDSLLLVEPSPNGDCIKTRLHTKQEGLDFAETLAERMGMKPADFGVYKCQRCPRHPATTERFWHVGNKDPQLKAASQAGAGLEHRQAHCDGRTIGQMVSPEVMARLRSVQ